MADLCRFALAGGGLWAIIGPPDPRAIAARHPLPPTLRLCGAIARFAWSYPKLNNPADKIEMIEWYEAVDVISPHIVHLSTPRGSGTGFFVSSSPATGLCAVATAAHVVADSNWWEEPIRLYHPPTTASRILRENDRVITIQHDLDTAAVLFATSEFPFPPQPMPCIAENDSLMVGTEIGWMGFPAVSALDLCFFTGRISAWRSGDSSYLVDGVAINGVSGGPAFFLTPDGPMLIGVVSAYIPNLTTGVALPGLSVIRDVKQFQGLAKQFKTMDEAAANAMPAVPPAPSSAASVPASR